MKKSIVQQFKPISTKRT